MGTLTLGVNLILALASHVLTVEGCSSWSPEEQANKHLVKCLSTNLHQKASESSLYLHFASGRLAARLTPYVILLILKVDFFEGFLLFLTFL